MKSCVWSRVELSFQRPQGSNFLLGHLGHQMRGHSRQYCWTSKEILILKLVTLSLLQGYLWKWRHAQLLLRSLATAAVFKKLSQTACCRMWQSSLFVFGTVSGIPIYVWRSLLANGQHFTKKYLFSIQNFLSFQEQRFLVIMCSKIISSSKGLQGIPICWPAFNIFGPAPFLFLFSRPITL